MPPFLTDLVAKYGSGRSLSILAVGVVTVVAVLALSRWATAPAWITVQPGMPLEMVGEVASALDEARVPYRLSAGGADLRVAESDLARARVLLAQQGLPTAGAPGFELFDQPSWGMTDFTQRVNYRRALEGELERTIGQMSGIDAARVHLALHEQSVLRRSEKSGEASVVLRLRSGARPDAELVEGIAFLVASSVEGLTSEHITIMDDTGRLLTATVEPGGIGGGTTKRQMAMQRDLELHLQQKVETLVGEMVGAGNVRARVSADLSFQRVDRTVQSVDPDQQVVSREERQEITPGPTTPGAGSTVQNTTYEVTRRLETVTGGVGELERLSVAVLLNEAPPAVEGAAATPRSPEELARIEGLVRAAVGIAPGRGDVVSVVSVPFSTGPVMEVPAPAGPGVWALIERFQRPVMGLLALLLAVVVALNVIGALRKSAVPYQRPAVPAALRASPDPHEAVSLRLGGDREERRLVPDRRHDQLTATVAERPDNAVRVLRAWMKDG